MGVRERILETLGIPTAADIERRVENAYEAGYYDGNDDPASGDLKAGGMGYKRVTDGYLRESGVDFQKALRTAWTLWQKSPIAKRVLVMKRDHIIGHAAKPSANDDSVLEILDEFWAGNKLDKRASEFTMQLFGFGEQCYPAFVRESDGRVRIGYIDPQSIVKICKHPDNSLEDWAVVVEQNNAKGYMDKLVYRIIREDEDYVDDAIAAQSDNKGKLVTWEQATVQPWEEKLLQDYGLAEYSGSCFYFKVNAVSNQSRGTSDLLQVADWIDQADETLFAVADRDQMAGYFSWDVKLMGATDSQVKARAKDLRTTPPSRGSVNVHNDSEEWTFNYPDLKQQSSIESFRALLGLILGGMGFPVHWFGFGDDANRATAVAQGEPTGKSLEHDQAIIQDMFMTILQFVIDQADIAGQSIPEDVEITFDLPEVSVKDIQRIAASMAQMVQALVTSTDMGWITDEKAAQVFAKMLAELDIEIDPVAEYEAAAVEKEKAELDKVERQNAQLQQMMDYAGSNGQGPQGVPEETG